MAETSPLKRLAEVASVDFPHLFAARERTAQAVADRRSALESLSRDADVSVVLMGSWGRAELTSGSDDDYMVLVYGPRRDDVSPTIDAVAEVLGAGATKPGPEDLFGKVVYSDDLKDKIGLDRDSNANLTRRMLLLLESVPVLGEAAWRGAREEVLAGYLQEAIKDYRPPRFFLNDVIRYWRTVAVDFEAKFRDRAGQDFGLRNAKLRTSRKLLFASGLLPVLECDQLPVRQMQRFLSDRFESPPTDRIAEAFLNYDDVDAGVRTMRAYDQFIGLLDRAEFRDSLKALSPRDVQESHEFAHARSLGREIQAGLLSLLYETPELYPRVREYVVF
jgi:hypothetical protein